MGWSVDSQQLFIGNDTIANGAPEIGNTEILTQHSDILSIAAAYTYEGTSVGYTVQTGPSPTSPVQRSLQQRLDDTVNVKDFGAMGDGTTNDLAAINRALFQLYCRFAANPAGRKVLYFPAGTYIISGGVVQIPTYASLLGEGKGRTIIQQTDNTQAAVVKLADSLQQIDNNIGTNGATPPINIDVSGMSFVSQFDQPILSITAARGVNFSKVGFQGSLVLPATSGNGNACVSLFSFTAINTQNIEFDSCEFSGLGYAFQADHDMQGITVVRSYMHDLYQAAILGLNTNGIAPAVNGPTAFRFTNNNFDKIANIGLNVYNITGISSAFNYYGDVANANIGTGNPISYVISFLGTDNYSVGDTFNRNDADNGVWFRVFINNNTSYFIVPHAGTSAGSLRISPGYTVALADSQLVAGSTGIQLQTASASSYVIEYSIVRNTSARTGTILVSMTSAGQTIQDSSLEATGTVTGVTFSLSTLVSGSLAVNYTSTSTGHAPKFIYSIRRYTIAS